MSQGERRNGLRHCCQAHSQYVTVANSQVALWCRKKCNFLMSSISDLLFLYDTPYPPTERGCFTRSLWLPLLLLLEGYPSLCNSPLGHVLAQRSVSSLLLCRTAARCPVCVPVVGRKWPWSVCRSWAALWASAGSTVMVSLTAMVTHACWVWR